MPTMPTWAEGARIIYDTEHGLAFIRRGRRALWEPYAVTPGELKHIDGVTGRMKLEIIQRDTLEAIGKALTKHVTSLHPQADKLHLGFDGYYDSRIKEWIDERTACGVEPDHFQKVNDPGKVTCHICLAVFVEDLNAKITTMGPEIVAQARQHVRDVRAFNALGHVVDGEDATGKL